MITIYDLEKTLLTDKDEFHISTGGKQYVINTEALGLFFQTVIEEQRTFAQYEQLITKNKLEYHTMIESLSKIMDIPENTLDATDEEFHILILKLLFNVNQRIVQRYIFNNVLNPD